MKRAEKLYYGLSALCLLLGLLMRFVFTAVRFTGFLFCCAAGVCALLGILSHWSAERRWASWGIRALWAFVAAGFALFAVLEVWVVSWSGTDWAAEPDAIVVFGAGVNGSTPSLSLTVRLERALQYAAGRDCPIIVTGSQGPGEDISEAACMAQWLQANGLDGQTIFLEDQADNTEENVRYSKALLSTLGIPADADVALVTSDYHLCRVRLLWGDGAVPVGAHLPANYLPLTVNYYIREAFALAAALVF